MAPMAVSATPRRIAPWLDGGDDWSWPGRRTPEVELGPPAWVPALPRRLEPVLATTGAVAAPPAPARRARRRPAFARRALALTLLAAFCATFAVAMVLRPQPPGAVAPTPRAARDAADVARSDAVTRAAANAAAAARAASALPVPAEVSRDAAGAQIDAVRYPSAVLHAPESFLVYLPPGYDPATSRYPVLYLLHGLDEPGSSFLALGLRSTLDELIAARRAPPIIAVMLEAGPQPANWRNLGSRHYEDYVIEVQRLTDRLFATVPDRDGRAIAGFSMGGFGAMNVALGHLATFSVVESWLGFFNGLDGELSGDRAALATEPLHAFVYGGAQDTIADPGEDAPFAAALRAAGAQASGAVYPGGHDFATLRAHLRAMLLFAAHTLA